MINSLKTLYPLVDLTCIVLQNFISPVQLKNFPIMLEYIPLNLTIILTKFIENLRKNAYDAFMLHPCCFHVFACYVYDMVMLC